MRRRIIGAIFFLGLSSSLWMGYIALSSPSATSSCLHILTPALFQAAATISTAIAKPVTHARLSPDELRGVLTTAAGMPAWLAEVLAWLSEKTAEGVEERKFKEMKEDDVEVLLGRKGKTFQKAVLEEKARGAWDA